MAKNANQSQEDISDKVIFDLPHSVGTEFSSALRTILVEATTTSWEFWFGLLEDYNRIYGSALVPKDFENDAGFKLGDWVSNQRVNKNKLSEEQKDRLEAISGWFWNRYEANWINGLEELDKFLLANGDLNIPDNYIAENGYKLGRWVRNRRNDYSKGKLSLEKIYELEAREGWVWDALAAQWDHALRLLISYEREHGNSRVPTYYIANDGTKLGQWVSVQRQNYAKGKLSEERISSLSKVNGWVWNIIDHQYIEGIQRTKDYYGLHKKFPPQSFVDQDGFKLGIWLNTVRQRKNNNPAWVVSQLEEMGFSWNPFRDQWFVKYDILRKFNDEFGHPNVNSKFKYMGINLGNWVNTQRHHRKKGKLTTEQIDLLDNLGFAWEVRHRCKG